MSDVDWGNTVTYRYREHLSRAQRKAIIRRQVRAHRLALGVPKGEPHSCPNCPSRVWVGPHRRTVLIEVERDMIDDEEDADEED